MKNKFLKGVFYIYAMSLLIACTPKSEEPLAPVVDTIQIKKEIQAKENEFAATYNARELKNIGYYAEDATTFRQNKPPLVGKAAIVAFLKDDINTFSKSNKISFTTNEIYVSDGGDQVVEIGYYKVVDAANTAINTGNYMSLFVKKDGKYFCLRDMSVSDIPIE
ncbi:MAG: nuclear transport factor 2 family protein [Bacteroidetes bacterium]|nr:nuclear transport factor 2 family protein [Bacteroidota bacterium]